jgi:hypothetical protein
MAHEATADHKAGHGAEASKRHSDKVVALLISVLTLFLAFADALGSANQTEALSANVEASDLWAFYEAKSIRAMTLRTAAQALQLDLAATSDAGAKSAMQQRIDGWLKDAARYESEPSSNEGAKELDVRATEAEHKRDRALGAYHQFEVASAVLSIGIVLGAATVITGMIALAYIAGALGIIGLIFMTLGLLAPQAVHLL